MSFDLGVWNMEGKVDEKVAYTIYERLANSEVSEVLVSKNVSGFVEELEKRYPDLNTFDDENVDDCVWNSDLEMSESYVIMNIAWARAEEVYSFVEELARKYQLVFYDPQEDISYDFRNSNNDKSNEKKKWWSFWNR